MVLSNLGEDGENLCHAFVTHRRNETSACACAMRLLRDRSTLSRCCTQRDDMRHPQSDSRVSNPTDN